ncbi:hypothetical protein [Rheinheimera sp. SA_1]|uniref:hypothetical protein n=1 Tax=Rheinheimera sp. SA_1 TaxID=1827365 RepID=UPI00082D5F1F|nr:hypothetical protein [Rheinheimera sp. SA_1]
MFYLLLVSMLFVSCMANAVLMRGGGKGNNTSSEAQNFYRIADEYVNALGVKPSFIATDHETLVQGQIPAFAVPTYCYVDVTTMPPDFVNDPCYYQFYQNELLQFEGYMGMFFENAPLMDLVWTLTGADYSQSFAGSHLERAAFLDTTMPLLAAGEYQIGLKVTFYAGQGFKFYTDPSVHSDNLNCGELIPGDESSGSCSYSWAAAESLSFSSDLEKVIILSGNKPLDIPIPATTALLLLGGSVLRWRIRK